jgi:hypothetical protein
MKMADGRKTRGKIGQKSEKAKLDKEWNQVNKLFMLALDHWYLLYNQLAEPKPQTH